jgi:non-ribosomal peptide synthetase component F
MEPSNPVERLLSIVEMANMSVVLTDEASREVAQQLVESPQNLDELGARSDQAVGVVPVHPEDISYLVFTSGSTGKPKGIPISHRSILSFVRWYEEAVALTERDAFMVAGSLTFDMHV